MILTDFRTLIRALVPGAIKTVISDTVMDLLINKGVDEVNVLADALTNTASFTATAEKGEYNIFKEVAKDFIAPGKTGLWWDDGTQWRQLDSETLKSMNVQYPTWRNDDSGDPRRFYQDGNRLVIHPKPDTTLVQGFLFDDYIQAATKMTDGTHFPFTGNKDEELVMLRPLDDAIIDYVRYRLQVMVGKDQKGVISEQEFLAGTQRKAALIQRRPDFGTNINFRMRGPHITRR